MILLYQVAIAKVDADEYRSRPLFVLSFVRSFVRSFVCVFVPFPQQRVCLFVCFFVPLFVSFVCLFHSLSSVFVCLFVRSSAAADGVGPGADVAMFERRCQRKPQAGMRCEREYRP
jgi:hypothetical protein